MISVIFARTDSSFIQEVTSRLLTQKAHSESTSMPILHYYKESLKSLGLNDLLHVPSIKKNLINNVSQFFKH